MQDYAEQWKADLFLQPGVGIKWENQTAVTFSPFQTKNQEQINFRQLKNCLPPAHPQRSLEQGQFGVQIVFSF